MVLGYASVWHRGHRLLGPGRVPVQDELPVRALHRQQVQRRCPHAAGQADTHADTQADADAAEGTHTPAKDADAFADARADAFADARADAFADARADAASADARADAASAAGGLRLRIQAVRTAVRNALPSRLRQDLRAPALRVRQ